MDLYSKLGHPNLILKLGMEKAYDRVDWSFLIFMLKQFGFNEWVIDLLFQTLSNNWFSILINEELVGFFKSTRGVRQSDPLSSASFLSVTEFLGRSVHNLFLNDKRRFYVLGSTEVLYLAFANDIILFTRCSANCLDAIKEFLGLY